MGTILCNDICIPLGKNHLLARQQTTEQILRRLYPVANASLACPTGSHPLSWISSLLYPYGTSLVALSESAHQVVSSAETAEALRDRNLSSLR